MFPLGLLAIGESAEIVESCGCLPDPAPPQGGYGRGHGHRHRHGCIGCGLHGSRGMDSASRIEDMGIREGKTVEMLNNEGGMSLLVRVDETRIALSRSVAMKIMVKRKEDAAGNVAAGKGGAAAVHGPGMPGWRERLALLGPLFGARRK